MGIEQMERRLARLEIRAELENIVGTYVHLLAANAGEEIIERLWAHNDDVRIEIGASGPYQSRDKVATYYQKDHRPGRFLLTMPTAPVIAVAEDMKTARGLWLTIGTETDSGDLGSEEVDANRRALLSSQTEDGKAYMAEWSFQKMGIDFIEEDGQWRILHLHIYEIMRAPFDRDWVRYATERFDTDGRRLDAMFQSNRPFPEDKPPENLATGPSGYHWQYTIDQMTEAEPLPPTPYQSLDGDMCF